MSDKKKQALKAADAYFAKIGASPEWPEALRSDSQPGERNPLLPIVFADGWLDGWHARDEEAHQEQDDLREILDEHRKALRACKEERDRKTAEKSELRGERDRERARAEAAEAQARRLDVALSLARREAPMVVDRAMATVNILGPDGAMATFEGAMREVERADGGGEEATAEDRPDPVLLSRFAPGTRLIWYPRSRSRPHYDERVPAVVVRDDGDGPWLMVRVRTKTGREHDRWVERGELSLEPTGEASGEMETRLKQAEEAERDFYRRQGKL